MSHRPRTPDQYAAEKIGAAMTLWNGELGASQRRLGGILASGIAPEAWAGFGTNGSPNDQGGTAAFWEYGWAGISGGSVRVSGPSCDRSTENNWCDYYNDHRVVYALNRSATLAPGGWRQIDDQTAIGIVSILEHGYSVVRMLDERIRPSGDYSQTYASTHVDSQAHSLFFVFLAFAGWSAGSPRAARQVNHYADALAGVPENGRVGMLLWLYARDAIAGAWSIGQADYSNPFYTLVRTWQKIAAAGLIATRSGSNTSFFDLNGAADWHWVQSVITVWAYGLSASEVVRSANSNWKYDPPSSPALKTAAKVVIAVVALSLSALLIDYALAPIPPTKVSQARKAEARRGRQPERRVRALPHRT